MFYNTKRLSEVANHFTEFGVFTKEPIGSKAYLSFWDRERDRCINGIDLGDIKITGYHYHYLNYCPILQTKVIRESTKEGEQNQAIRIKGFPKFHDGQKFFFDYLEQAERLGRHAEMLGSRGKGKSLMVASMGNRNYFHIKDSKTFYVASRETYLLGDGILPKVWDIMNFIDSNTPWGKRRHEHNTALHRKASVKIKNALGVETVDPRSWNSEIIGINVGDDINKLRGLRGKLIVYEEYGSFPNINKGWNINRPAVEEGSTTYGMMLAIGTGGDEGSNFEGAEELFNKPGAYNIHPVKNIWDEGMENTECGFFYPAYLNYDSSTMDEDGNSDVEKAKKLIEIDRKSVAKGNDPHAVTRRKAEIPIYPREAMMKITGSKFPIADLMEHLAQVEGNPHKYKSADYIGKLILNKEGQVEWKLDDSVNPIYSFPHKDNKNLPGGLIIWEQPYYNNAQEIPSGMYLAGTDSYDHDESITTSLGSTWIMNIITGRLVAEYTGRPSSEDYYEGVRRMLIYFNALCNPENHNKGIIDYFIRKNSEYLFCDQPRIVADINNNHKTTVSRRKGTPPTKEINSYGRTLISEWLMQPAVGQDLVPGQQPLLQLHKIRSIPLLKELVYWNIDGNFDRVSALGMLMILWKDRERILVEMESSVKFNINKSYFTRKFKSSLSNNQNAIIKPK